jgi:hypothetical protein
MAPLKVELALLKVKFRVPKATAPEPDRVEMLAPLVVAEMSKVPAVATPLEEEMLPAPLRAKIAPLSIVVAPV